MSCQRTSSSSRTVLDQANIRPPVRWSTSKRKTSQTQQHYWVATTSGKRKVCQSRGWKPSSSCLITISRSHLLADAGTAGVLGCLRRTEPISCHQARYYRETSHLLCSHHRLSFDAVRRGRLRSQHRGASANRHLGLRNRLGHKSR
jgi:hypothetical protein